MGPKGKPGPSDIPRFVPKWLNGNVFPGVYANYSFSYPCLWYSRYWLQVNSSFETFSKVLLDCDLNGPCKTFYAQETTMKALYVYVF